MGPGRDVEGLVGQRTQLGLLLGDKHLGGTQASGAVDPHPRHLLAPALSPNPAVLEIPEVFASEEVAPHVLHHSLDTGFGQRRRLHRIPMIASR
jgi:hypothetical protein